MIEVDVIGALYDLSDPKVPVRLWGFHVNVTPEMVAANPSLSSAVMPVTTLRRVWSGDDPANPQFTVPLRFNGEAAARAALSGGYPDDAEPMANPSTPPPKGG